LQILLCLIGRLICCLQTAKSSNEALPERTRVSPRLCAFGIIINMRESFEASSLERVDREKAHKKAESVLSGRVKESDFVDVYGEQEVARDLEKVEELKRKFVGDQTPESAETKKIADIFEAIVLEHGELSEWFGENGFTVGVSEYDDFINGVDMVVEFCKVEKSETPHLALGMDVTFTSDTTAKFDRLREQIENGQLAKVKYFSSEHSNIRGGMDNIPEVIVGVDRKTVEELMELWLEKDNRALEGHRVQIMILKEIEAQLRTFAEYSKSLGNDDLTEIYKSRLKIVMNLLAQKTKVYKKVALDLDTDSVYMAITDYMRRWQKIISQPEESKGITRGEEIEQLSLKESLTVQRELILSSGLEPAIWISQYAEHFQKETAKDSGLRYMVRNDLAGAAEEISKRLYYGDKLKKVA